ncbi:GNAT family N-acetyltransferase [Oryzibacter oryziterrae]|uniref:GNAT family N-acetyltransferase n=1 Tax=Oryzibacter oryziterrae TaxID=2766474 RepID=UPI001F38BDFE|nr:GNAT family protein [Oryzibacter oryziterrae]
MDAIETDRLVLRNFRASDAADLFAYLHAPRASCFYSLTLDDMAAAEAEALRRSQDDEYIAVCLKASDRVIGDVFATAEDDSTSIGWNFNADVAGQGFAHEAAQALVAHLFGARQVRRLYAYAEDDNLASRRLCEKLGMRQEGVFLEFVTFGNDQNGVPIYENTVQYALLRKEWLARR